MFSPPTSLVTLNAFEFGILNVPIQNPSNANNAITIIPTIDKPTALKIQ